MLDFNVEYELFSSNVPYQATDSSTNPLPTPYQLSEQNPGSFTVHSKTLTIHTTISST